jgi:phosphatidylserine/phosphatidylglycerophosphate/cardiolipin synthase-like enzyme
VTASLSVADSATGSPQTVALTGNGPGTTNLTQTFYVEPAAVYTSAYAFVDQATSTVDMTMYEDTDTTMTTHFINAGKAGVKVRIILDTNGEKSNNTAAYNALTGQTNVSVVWANKSFADTHEKSLIIDAAISGKAMAAIYTGNLSSQYYSTSRDFLIYENDPNDVAAMETTFNSDFSNGGGTTYTPSGYTPPTGDDLVWSPTNARTAITAVINNATTTLTLDEEEMSDTGIGNALAAAASRGVVVKLALTASTSSSTTSVLNTIKAAGGHIVTYPSSGSGLYIHAKAIVADFGLATETAFMGSENCSTNSLQNNRELGIVLTDSTSTNSKSIISSLNDVLLSDTACKSSPTAINTSSPSSCTAY